MEKFGLLKFLTSLGEYYASKKGREKSDGFNQKNNGDFASALLEKLFSKTKNNNETDKTPPPKTNVKSDINSAENLNPPIKNAPLNSLVIAKKAHDEFIKRVIKNNEKVK